MIYMVEMALIATERRAEWDAWYLAHMHKLISIPGIRATQRFESLSESASPFVALHQVDGPEVFTSDTYRAKAGPGGTGEWKVLMNNWYRNVFDGIDTTPDVPLAGALVVVEDGASAGLVPVTWMQAIGLDQSSERRAIGVAQSLDDVRGLIGRKGVRICKPLTPRLAEQSV